MVKKTKKTRPKTLSRLTERESSMVLSSLLKEQPKLLQKTEMLAKNLLKNISVEDVAEDVKMSILAIDDLDNLNDRAGSHSWGYVEPSEAAAELCEEAVEEFFKDMRRRLELEDFVGAATVCQGLVSGLYELKGETGAVIGWAGEDTMCDLAGHAVETLMKSIPKQKQQNLLDGKFLSDAFLTNTVPKWEDWLRKLRNRPKRS